MTAGVALFFSHRRGGSSGLFSRLDREVELCVPKISSPSTRTIVGLDAAKKAIPPSWVRVGMVLGVFLYGGTGVLTWVLGGEFLNYGVLTPDHPSHGQHYGILLVELGVLFAVASVMLAIFYAFGSRQAELSDEDW